MDRRQLLILGSAFTMFAGDALAAPASTWDDLVKVNSKKLKLVYLLPGADFRAYHKIMLDPAVAAVRKNWQRDYNRTSKGVSGKLSDGDIRRGLDDLEKSAGQIYSAQFSSAGYPIVTAPAPDVLRVAVAIINIRVSAPDVARGSRTRSYSREAGSATMVVEARDSMTEAILGRAVDSRIAGDTSILWARTSAGNRADFETLIRDWAKTGVNGLNELKQLSPISQAG
jgi:hypothetical protein